MQRVPRGAANERCWMKALKFIAIGLAALIVLAVVAAVIVAATFDPNQYKPQIVQLVKERYGRTLAIEGSIGLSFFPRIGASVNGLTLSEPNSQKSFAKVGEAKVSVALLPLFARKVIVDRVELGGLDAGLVKYKNGRTNFDDLLGKTDKPAPAKPAPKSEQPGAAPLVIDISGIALRNAGIGWRDETSGTAVRLSNVDLTTGRIASGVPGKLSFSGRVQGGQPKLNALVKLASGYRIDFGKPAVQLNGLDLQLQGDVPGIAGLKASAAGDLGWAAGNRIDVANLKLDASSKDGLEAKVSAPRFRLSPERSESSPIEASIRLAKAPRRLEAKLTLAAVKATGERVDFSSLAIQLDMKQNDLALQGRLTTPLSLQIDSSQATLPQLAGNFTVSGPALPNQSLQLAVAGNARANWDKKNAQADLSARFDESNAKLKVSIADFERLAPSFELLVDRLNVDRYTGGKERPGGKGSGKSAGSAPAKDQPIDLSALKSINGFGSARIGSLVASGIKAENVQVSVKAAGGRVDLSPVAAQLYQGSLAGAVSLNANNQQFVVRQQLSNVAIGPLLRDAADKDLLEGRGNVALDVTTAGNTVSALKRGLNGKASLNLRDGSIKGMNLAELARRARSLRSGQFESSAAKTEKTDFSELNASFAIKNGVAHNEDFTAKSPFIRVAGAGDVDIGAGTLDYRVKASIVATSTGQEGKALADVRGITFPVRLTGPFDNLKYSVDAGALVTETAKEEIRKRLEERLGEKAGRIGDALKGLLGR